MGAIQNAINQTLGTVAIAGRLAPGLEKKQELRDIKKAMAGYKKQAITLDSETAGKPLSDEILNLDENLGRNIVEKSQRRFELDPSKDNYDKLQNNIKAYNKVKEDRKLFEDWKARRDEAMQKVADKQNNAQAQKNDFANYVKNIEIKGGGKVGDLPEWAQAHIMQTLKKEEEDK